MNPTICPSCGRPAARAVALSMYRYKESGIPNLWLHGGVTETTCASCKSKLIKIEKEAQLLQVLTVAFLEIPRPLTGHEMRFLRGSAQLSQALLAEELHLRRATIAEREGKGSDAPGITFEAEVGFRLVILKHFVRNLQTQGNFLPDEMWPRLTTTAGFLTDFMTAYGEQLRKSVKLVATMDHDEESWKLDKAA